MSQADSVVPEGKVGPGPPAPPTKVDTVKSWFLNSRAGALIAIAFGLLLAFGAGAESVGKYIDTAGKLSASKAESAAMALVQFTHNRQDSFFVSVEDVADSEGGGGNEPDVADGLSLVFPKKSENYLFKIEDPFLGYRLPDDHGGSGYYSKALNSRDDVLDALAEMKKHQAIREAQKSLIGLGYLQAPLVPPLRSWRADDRKTKISPDAVPNGFLDRRTIQGIRVFQKDRGLPVTGTLDRETAEALAARSPAVAGDDKSYLDLHPEESTMQKRFSVRPDFRGELAASLLQDETFQIERSRLVASFDEIQGIILGLRSKDDAKRRAVESKLRPVFDVTLLNNSTVEDVATHIEIAVLRAEGEAGDAGEGLWAETVEVVHRYTFDVVELAQVQQRNRLFPRQALVPPMRMPPGKAARFQVQFTGKPETPMEFAIHMRIFFAKADSIELPIVELPL